MNRREWFGTGLAGVLAALFGRHVQANDIQTVDIPVTITPETGGSVWSESERFEIYGNTFEKMPGFTFTSTGGFEASGNTIWIRANDMAHFGEQWSYTNNRRL